MRRDRSVRVIATIGISVVAVLICAAAISSLPTALLVGVACAFGLVLLLGIFEGL